MKIFPFKIIVEKVEKSKYARNQVLLNISLLELKLRMSPPSSKRHDLEQATQRLHQSLQAGRVNEFLFVKSETVCECDQYLVYQRYYHFAIIDPWIIIIILSLNVFLIFDIFTLTVLEFKEEVTSEIEGINKIRDEEFLHFSEHRIHYFEQYQFSVIEGASLVLNLNNVFI